MSLRDQKGGAIAVVAIMLPVFLVFLAFAIDYGGLALKQTQLQVIADTSAEAGMSKLRELIEQKILAHNPPPDALNILDYLTDEDRRSLGDINDASGGKAVVDTIRAYANNNLAKNNMRLDKDEYFDLKYPYTRTAEFNPQIDAEIALRLTLMDDYDLFLGAFVGKSTSTIKTAAEMTIPIR